MRLIESAGFVFWQCHGHSGNTLIWNFSHKGSDTLETFLIVTAKFLIVTRDTTPPRASFLPSSKITNPRKLGIRNSKRSISAYVVKMGSGAISWASRLQTVHALSTTEAEYISATSAAQEMLWLRNLFTEFGYPCDKLPLFMDNQSAIQVAKNPEHYGCIKHLDPCFYWLRDVVTNI